MSEIGKEIDKKLGEKELDAEGNEKPELRVAKLGNFKYISTEKGVELLRQFQDMFDLMDGWEGKRQEYCKAELQNAENRMRNTVETKDLTFMDGVLVTWNIFNRILDKYLRDENGEPEQGISEGHSYDYLGPINDDVTSLLWDKVLEHGYLKSRGEYLSNQFCVNME